MIVALLFNYNSQLNITGADKRLVGALVDVDQVIAKLKR